METSVKRTIKLTLRLSFLQNNQIKMDLLGSILDSMEKPPEVDEKRKEEMKSWQATLFISNLIRLNT